MTADYDFVTEAWEGAYVRNLHEALKRHSPDIKRESPGSGVDFYLSEFLGGQAGIYHVAHPQGNSLIVMLAGLSGAVRQEFEKLRLTLKEPLTFGCQKNQDKAKLFGQSVLNDYFLSANDPCHRVTLLAPVSASRD